MIAIGKIALQSLISMGMALLTEGFLKDVVLLGLDWVSHKTKNTKDDELVMAVRRAWSKDK